MDYVVTPRAPQAAGHYSQAVSHQGLVYVAGQVPRLNGPSGNPECPASIEAQAVLVFHNLAAILEAANSGIDRVLKLTIYLTDLGAWGTVNEICATVFGAHRPARTMVPVSNLRHHYQIEIDAIAAVRDM